MAQVNDPLLVISSLGGPFTDGGITVTISIVRLPDTRWSLEIVTADGTSITWDDGFSSRCCGRRASGHHEGMMARRHRDTPVFTGADDGPPARVEGSM
jgi:hypothetical protein